MNPAEAPAAKTHSLLLALYKIRKASLTDDFQSRVSNTVARRVRNAKTEELIFGRTVFFISANRKKQNWQEMGRAMNNYWAFWVQIRTGTFRVSYFEVGLEDMRSANSLFGITGCDGALTLHIPNTKFPIHYLLGPQTLVFLTKMRNGYLRGNRTTWGNADTRIRP